MSDRFEQQLQSLVDYAEPPSKPLKARSLKDTDLSVSNADKPLFKLSEAQNVAPDRPA